MNAAAIIARARRVFALPASVPATDRNAVAGCGAATEHGRRLCASVPWAVASAVLDAADDGDVTVGGYVSAIGPGWAVYLRIVDLPADIARRQVAYDRQRAGISASLLGDPARLWPATDAELAAEAQQVARALVAADPVPHLTADDAARCVALTIEAFADAVACGEAPDLSCVESLFADSSIAALQPDAYHAAIDAIERLARIAVGEGGAS